jgi:hypothetical protein
MKIILNTGAKESKEFIVDKEIVTVGRSNKCDICIPSDHISRQHLQISIKDGAIFVKDLTLSNWVSYNDEKLQKNIETQYFDFANLTLPGNLSFKIELDFVEEDTGFNYRDQLNRTSSNMTSLPSNPDTDTDILEKDSYQDPSLQQKLNSAAATGGDTKSRQRILIMGVAFIGICFYIFFTMAEKKVKNKTISQNDVRKERKSKSKRRLNRKTTVSTKPSKSVVVATDKSESQKQFESMYTNEKSCKKGYAKRICSVVLKDKKTFEGAILQERTLHVFKNLKTRIKVMFKRRGSFGRDALANPHFERIIAGEYILLPNVMEEMERQKISKVKVHIFSMKGTTVSYISTYSIDPSYYRRYDLEEYNKSYSLIRKALDTSMFSREFTRFLIKED